MFIYRSLQITIPLAFTLMCASGFAQNTPSQAMQDLKILSGENMQGRDIGSSGNGLARDYIIKRISELGLKPCAKSFVQEFKVQGLKQASSGKNILACQYAQENKAAKYIVVSAHYDHLGINNNKVYFGADDNASGVAGVLAVAQSFKGTPSKHHLVYAFFDGEERGLLGANAFIKQSTIAPKDIAVNINFDMIARGDKNELYISGTHQNPVFKPLLADLDNTKGVRVLFDHDKPEQGSDDWTSQSDHYAFFKAGIPHLYFGVEDHADYHKPTDTFEKVQAQFFDASIEIVQKAVKRIDQQYHEKK